MRIKAEKGHRTCSGILGYDLCGRTSLSINEREAEYVRFCFEEYLKRKNLSEVAAEARVHGYYGKCGKIPTACSIQVIITRPVYCGFNSFQGHIYKGNHTPIVSVDVYNKVQSLLCRQGKISSRSRIYEIQRLKECNV